MQYPWLAKGTCTDLYMTCAWYAHCVRVLVKPSLFVDCFQEDDMQMGSACKDSAWLTSSDTDVCDSGNDAADHPDEGEESLRAGAPESTSPMDQRRQSSPEYTPHFVDADEHIDPPEEQALVPCIC